jgi:multiple sugar transport system permease protein
MEATGIKPLGRERIWLGVLLFPTIIGIVFGTFGSVVATLLISFTNWDLLTQPRWVGLANYGKLFANEDMLTSLTNTVKFSLLYVPGVVVISMLVAVLMNRKIHGISLFRTAYFLPVVTSAVAAALVWQMILGRDTGLMNFIIEHLGGKPICWFCTKTAIYSVAIVNIWGAIGEGMIIFLAGLQAIPREYFEASTVDGANERQQFFQITLPLITPSIFFQTLITTINAFQAYEYIYMLTRRGQGDSSVPVLVFSIYRNAFNFFRMGEASALAIELAIIVIALMAIYLWMERRFVVYE